LKKYPLQRKVSLKNKTAITNLFENGKAKKLHPVKIIWSAAPARQMLDFQVLFVVPKRYFRHAVARNRAKRLLREAFRLNQNLLSPQHNNSQYINEGGMVLYSEPLPKIIIALCYVAPKLLPFEQIVNIVAHLLTHVYQNCIVNKSILLDDETNKPII
jgi:ribonuclease P protein component